MARLIVKDLDFCQRELPVLNGGKSIINTEFEQPKFVFSFDSAQGYGASVTNNGVSAGLYAVLGAALAVGSEEPTTYVITTGSVVVN